jgi:hypothetical protein
VATFFRTTIKYAKRPAYAVILDKVPGLSQNAKCGIRKFVGDRQMGVHNNPRPFSTPALAKQGIVSQGRIL